MKIHSSLLFIRGNRSIFKHSRTFWCLTNLLIAVFTFLLWLPATYSQDEVGVIHGKLTDKKLGKPIINHPVTLNIHKAAEVTQKETKTDSKGGYRFEDLPIDHQTHYTISTIYDGVTYTEKALVLTSFVPNLPVNIDIAGLTDDPSQIRIRSYTALIGLPPEGHPKDGAVSVFEAFEIENRSDSSFQMLSHNNKKIGFHTNLPQGYEGFKPFVPTNLTLHADNDQAILTNPLPPGTLQVGYSYILHLNRAKLDLFQRLPFHLGEISVLIQDGINLVPHLKHFKKIKSESIHNVIYTTYRAKPNKGFAANKKINLKIRIPGQNFSVRQTIFIALASALTGVFLAVAIFMLRRARRASVESDASQGGPIDIGWLRKLNNADIEHARTTRLEFITRLDEMHEKQDISERVYNRLRKEQAERLADILDQRKERGLDN